jgi:prepilin-type N-terminal cleavage/methylation domain-containing protein
MRRTAGFTLLEMLVATGIFLVGFSAAYGLFALGMYYRQQSESLTKSSLAANALMDEFRLESGLEGTRPAPYNQETAPCKPPLYVGDGFAGNKAEGTPLAPDVLFPYRPLPGVFYVVTRCTDLAGGDDALTTTLHLTLVVVPLPIDDNKPIPITELRRRFRINPTSGTNSATNDVIIDELVKRGIAFRFHSALLRRASWLPRG